MRVGHKPFAADVPVAHIKPISQGIYPECVVAKVSDQHPHKETHRSHCDTPYLPRLLQLGCPPLLQDGLHGADEFCSDILEKIIRGDT